MTSPGRAQTGAPRPAAGGWLAAIRAFDQVLDAPEDERGARVDELLALDPPLGAAVSRLLRAHEAAERGQGGAWLERGPRLASPTPDRGPSPGTRFGPWRLLREIGRGGMSRVWLARRDDIPWAREVALKLPLQVPLRLGAGDPAAGEDPAQRELSRRFVIERDLLSRLEHPHIARLYDAGFSDGIPWLALEYVQGEDLLAWCNRHSLPVRERVRLFRQALQAVRYAHAALIVHRDIKPANLLVGPGGVVRLLDFGIGRLLDPEGLLGMAPGEQPTGTHARPMTPAYASPEQWRHEPLTTATDLYSLGVVLHELLSGRHPFDAHAGSGGKPPHGGPAGAFAPAASRVAARGGTPEARDRARVLRGDLDAVIARALHPEVAGRYPSVAEFDADLERWLEGRPVRARRATAWRAFSLTLRRHPLASASAATAMLAILTSAGIAWNQARVADDRAGQTRATLDFLLRTFAGADADTTGGEEVRARTLLERGDAELARAGSMPAATQARIHQAMARIWFSLSDLDRAAASAARRTALLRDEGPAARLDLADALADEARLATVSARWALAAERLEQGRAALAEASTRFLPGPAGDPGSPTAAGVQLRLDQTEAWIELTSAGRADRALARFDSVEARARTLGVAAVEVDAATGRQQALLELGRRQDALALAEAIVERTRLPVEGLSTTDRLSMRDEQIGTLRLAGEFRRAWPLVLSLLDDAQAHHGANLPQLIPYRTSWLAVGLQMGRAPELARWLAQQPDIGPALELKGVDYATARRAIEARVWIAVGDERRAREALADAGQRIARSDAGPPEGRAALASRQLIAWIEAERWLRLGAAQDLARAKAVLQGPDWPGAGASVLSGGESQAAAGPWESVRLSLLGAVHLREGRAAEARASWEAALALDAGAPLTQGDHPRSARLQVNLAQLSAFQVERRAAPGDAPDRAAAEWRRQVAWLESALATLDRTLPAADPARRAAEGLLAQARARLSAPDSSGARPERDPGLAWPRSASDLPFHF